MVHMLVARCLLIQEAHVNEPFCDWRTAVDKRLQQIYCITVADAGFDEEYLVGHWRSNEAPFEFVEWYGNKYDLDPAPSPVQCESPKRGK